MSADLFEAFGSNPSPPATEPRREYSTQILNSSEHGHAPKDGSILGLDDTYKTHDHQRNQPRQEQQQSASLFRHDQSSGTDVLFDAADLADDFQDDDDGNDQDVFDDDFGDFETVNPSLPSVVPSALPLPSTDKAGSGEQTPSAARSATTTTPTFDLLGLDDFDGSGTASRLAASQVEQLSKASKVAASQRQRSDILDDWGDFADAVTSSAEAKATSSSLAPTAKPLDQRRQNEGAFPQSLGAKPSTGLNVRGVQKLSTENSVPGASKLGSVDRKSGQQTQSTKQISALKDEDEAWEDFVDGPPPVMTAAPAQSPSQPQPSGSATAPQDVPSVPMSAERPTNIPPPSILLQIFPQIITQKRRELPSPASAVPASTTLAESIRSLHSTAAKLIAGRSHRWKRDTLLSQAMTISAAGPVSSRGMKIATLDRMETRREEAEVAELISVWERNAHAFNTAITKAGVKGKAMVSLTKGGLNVRQMTGAGILTAKEPCALCGLKRNERIIGVDVDVEDSFGEWWVEFWGHRSCWEWWERYKDLLKQR